MKQIIEWLQDLPEDIRERAVRQCSDPDEIVPSLKSAIASFTQWIGTKEDFEFWAEVWEANYDRARALLNKPTEEEVITMLRKLAAVFYPLNPNDPHCWDELNEAKSIIREVEI